MAIEPRWSNSPSTVTPLNATRLNAYTPTRGDYANPNGNVTGSPGDIYINTTGGAGQTHWFKETGVATTTGWIASNTGSGSAPDATTSSKGIVQLAGDLAGTASAPTVPGLAAKADLTSGKVPTSELGAGAASGTTFLRGDQTWATAGGGSAPDATTSSKGIIQLAGHLAGTAAAPTVPGLLGKADLVSGVVPTSELGTGIANSTTFLRGDGTWAATATSGASNYVDVPYYNVSNLPIDPGTGSAFSVTLTKNSNVKIYDVSGGTGTTNNVIHLLLTQDATGGRTVDFYPGTIHWVPNARAEFNTLDPNWDFYTNWPSPSPTIDTTPLGVTYVRFTWLGPTGGWMGEIVTHIPALYRPVPATWNNTVNTAGNPQTVYLPGKIMRTVPDTDMTVWLDTFTNPTYVSPGHRQRIANHGGIIGLSRVAPDDFPELQGARGSGIGQGGTLTPYTVISNQGFGPSYPPGYGNIPAVALHEYAHLESDLYFTVSQPHSTYGTLPVSQHPTILSTFQATVAKVITITGAPAGGSFTLTYNSQTTSAITVAGLNAANIQAALTALSSIGSGNVTVYGGPGVGTPYSVAFANTLNLFNPPVTMTATPSFSGGSSPGISVNQTQGDVNQSNEWYAEMRKDQRLGLNSRQLDHCGTATTAIPGYQTPQNRVDAFNTYMAANVPI